MKKYYLSFAIIGVLAVLTVLFVMASNGKIFADTVVEGDNPQVQIKEIPLFSNSSGSETAEINLTVARGAKESFEVALENASASKFSNITVKKEPLNGASGSVILPDNIDERVIHIWQQRIVIPGKTFVSSSYKLGNIEELLVKNDKENFLSEQIGVTQDSLLSSSGSKKAKVADSRLEPVSMQLDAKSSKKLIFSVTAPFDKSGEFSGNMSFVDTTTNSKIKSFKLKVKVLDIDLVSGSRNNGKIFGCFTNDQIAKGNQAKTGTFVSEQTYINRMKVARETGCESLIIRFGKFTDVKRMLEVLSSLGFSGPIVMNYYAVNSAGTIITAFNDGATAANDKFVLNDSQAREEFKQIINEIKSDKAISVPIMFYGLDEPNINSKNDNNATKFAAHKKKIENITQLVGEILGSDANKSNIMAKVVSAANVYTSEQVKNMGEKYFSGLTIESMGDAGVAGNFSDRLNAVASGKPQLGRETYYFQGWNEYPNMTRLRSGFGFIRTGMSGFYVNPLWGYFNSKAVPVYLEDDTRPVPSSNAKPFMKQMMTFYPASDGLIPTVQSEGVREGILDSRYYLTYKDLQSTVSTKCASSAKDLTTLSAQIDQSIGQYIWNSDVFADSNIKPEQFEQTRDMIKTYLQNYSDNCRAETIASTRGFKVVAPIGTVASSVLTKDTRKVYGYDANISKWLTSPAKPQSLQAGNAYYLYVSQSTNASIKLEPKFQSAANRTLKKGWNLLSTGDNLPLSSIQTVIKDAKNNCSKTISLQTLIDNKYAYKGVYIINDEKATESAKAFKLYGLGSDKLPYIPANKGFWYYIFKMPTTSDSQLKMFDCR